MNDAQKKAIQMNWVFLLETVDIGSSSTLLDHLQQDRVIDRHQAEVVSVQAVSKDKVAKLLDILQRKSPEAFNKFLGALERSNQSHVAQRLREAFQPQQQQADGDAGRLV